MTTEVIETAEQAADAALSLFNYRAPDFRHADEVLADQEQALVWATTSIALSLIEIREIMGNAEYGERSP